MSKYYTRDDEAKRETIEWLQQSAIVPHKLISIALDQTKVQVFNAKKGSKRVTATPTWDAINLYIWLQYTHKWHEHEGRLQDGVMRCTSTYAMKALHLSHKRIKAAIDVLTTHDLISKKRYTLRNERGALAGSQQGIVLLK